jgi:hypothetical protein
MADRAPTNWEIVAAVKSILEANADLVDWFEAQVDHGLKVLEYDAATSPARLQVGVEVSRVVREPRVSCPKYMLVFDLHVHELGANTRTANEALGRLEDSVVGQAILVDAHVPAWGQVVLRNVGFGGRLGQAPAGDGWTVATTFEGLTYYYS